MSKKQQADIPKPIEFSVRNMGSILEGNFTQKPLTVFCGPNNSGKTWVMYALHAFYGVAYSAYRYRLRGAILSKDETDEQKRNKINHEIKKETSLPYFTEELERRFADYFNASDELFKDTNFKCQFSDEEWEEWISNFNDTEVFLMPAERNGLHLFYRELSAKRTALLHHVSKPNIDISKLLRDVSRTPYASPIADYIDWLNDLTDQPKTKSDFHKEASFLQKNLVQGAYNVNRRTGEITYKPYKKKDLTNNKLGLHVTSSTVKSLFGLWFYLEYQAEYGEVLMIDEPELNIHPENQLVIARLLARLVNAGIRVVISTHSDYIVREFNNLILLSEDKDGTLRKEYGYLPQEILRPDQMGAYLFDNNTIKPFKHTPGEGFAISTFDSVIKTQNSTSNALYYGLQKQNLDK